MTVRGPILSSNIQFTEKIGNVDENIFLKMLDMRFECESNRSSLLIF